MLLHFLKVEYDIRRYQNRILVLFCFELLQNDLLNLLRLLEHFLQLIYRLTKLRLIILISNDVGSKFEYVL